MLKDSYYNNFLVFEIFTFLIDKTFLYEHTDTIGFDENYTTFSEKYSEKCCGSGIQYSEYRKSIEIMEN